MHKLVLVYILAAAQFSLQAQSVTNMASNPDLPYREIPAYPETYTASSVAARMIDGLGFRFYWATDGLRPEDLAFRPSPESRTSEETIDHIMGLTNMILNALKKQPNVRSGEESSALTFEVKRKRTLDGLLEASNILKKAESDPATYAIILQSPTSKSELPFWNLLNGPISDALWHVGQVVTFRRSSGNPFNGKASVLTGKVRE